MSDTTTPFRFDDGASYERTMGRWSRPAGERFLDWLGLPAGLRYVDIGCGNGAFTELVVERCAPASVDGIDPSPGQIAFARTRPHAGTVTYRQGEAMTLPYADRSFDAALMALVIFFVPEPARGVAEMVRVLGPGGVAAAYAWDMHGGGFPYDALSSELRAMGHRPAKPPSVDASRSDDMHALWKNAGFEDVATTRIDVQRTFVDFDDWWDAAKAVATSADIIASLGAEEREHLRRRVRARLPQPQNGKLTCSAFANAVKGRLPGRR